MLPPLLFCYLLSLLLPPLHCCHAASVRYTPQPTLSEQQPTAELSSHSNGACRYGHEALQWVFAEPQLRCVGAGCDAPDAAECTAQLSVWCERLEPGSAEWGNCTPSATHRWHLDDAYNVLCDDDDDDDDSDNKCGHDAETCIFEYSLRHHHHYYSGSGSGLGAFVGLTAGSAAATAASASSASTVGALLVICVVAVAVAFLVFAVRHLLSDATAAAAATQLPAIMPYSVGQQQQQQHRGRSAAMRHLSAVATPAALPPVAHFVGGTHVD
jgi:hypothetical protein